MAKKDMSMDDLLKEGNGLLKRHGSVWSYPGAIVDASGTNLRLPLNYVTDAEVQEALKSGKLNAAVTDSYGRCTAVKSADSVAKVVSTAQAGSAEMGTELPVGSRVEHDAGRKPSSPDEAGRAAAAGMATVSTAAKAEVEGAEKLKLPPLVDPPKDGNK